MAPEPFGGPTVRRIEWLTLLIGGLGAAWAGWHWGWRGALGLMLGAGLSWINVRWLKSSVTAFGAAAAAQAAPGVAPAAGSLQTPPPAASPAPRGASIKFIGRFVLLVAAVYVILTRSWFPVTSVLAGLFAAAAGVLLGLAGELLSAGMPGDNRRGS